MIESATTEQATKKRDMRTVLYADHIVLLKKRDALLYKERAASILPTGSKQRRAEEVTNDCELDLINQSIEHIKKRMKKLGYKL